ncbi:disulfide isomerase DsbC N-terminal domain-containing protein [Psychrobacter sp. I-STPA10]|uniref:disulfide isomerase DsbC N-terminal domain-containing protein n=1 Tax=Psychrobacter sp. I-STPA10 TaxID=2585769 RepID=UPI001E55DC71|nr:disulfide isomerase DsbC N-terminal domain-containing protein [Psychrobacter sp. I-STPA10]
MLSIYSSKLTHKKSLIFALFLTSVVPNFAYAQTSQVSQTKSSQVSSQAQQLQPTKVPQSIQQHIRQTLQNAGIKVAILSIVPSKLPNMYQVNLAGQPPLHITADGQYVMQGELHPNPSPHLSTPSVEPKQPLGSPVSAALRQSLLANMSQLKNINADIPLFHTAVEGVIWGTTIEGVPFLVSNDGKYFTEGEISRIWQGQLVGLDAEFERRKNQQVFAQLDNSQLITYPATSPEQAVVYVATDIHCPYCRRFHRLIPMLNAKGVTIKTIGYPTYEESFEPMRQIWCEQNGNRRKQLFDQAMTQDPETLPLNQCANQQTNPLLANRNIAAGLAVFATPAIYRDDGEIYQGSFEHPEFLQFLGVQ